MEALLVVLGVVIIFVAFFFYTARASLRSEPIYSWQTRPPEARILSLSDAWSRLVRWLRGRKS